MSDKKQLPRVFAGWGIVWATGIISFWGQSFCNFGFAALFKPIASELGFTRAATSVASGVSRLEGGVVSPLAGWVTDRFGPRWIIFIGIFIVGLSLNLMYFVNSLWGFYLVWGLFLGIGTTLGLGIPQDKAITNWFVKKRGRALTIRWVLFAAAAVAGVPMIGWLVSVYGWRMSCVIAGCIVWLIGLPLSWFFIKQRRPEFYGLLPDGASTEPVIEVDQMINKGVKYAIDVNELEFTLRQSLKTPAFWLLLLGNATYSIVAPVIILHGVPMVTDMGVEPLKATLVVGAMGIGAIPGTLVAGLMTDRVKKHHMRYILAVGYAVELAVFAAFCLSPSLTMAYLIIAAHHFTGGAYGVLGAMLIARYFGRKAFGSIRGMTLTIILPATISAPIYAGWIFDTTGSYLTIIQLSTAFLVISLVTVLLAVPPQPPSRIGSIHQIV